jgi:hypothetical protein
MINNIILTIMVLSSILSISYLYIEGKKLLLPLISKKHHWFHQFDEDPRTLSLYRLCVITFQISLGLIIIDFILKVI